MVATAEEEAEKTEEDRDEGIEEEDDEEGVEEGEKRAVAGSPAKQRKRALKKQSGRPESGNKHDADEAKRVYSYVFAPLPTGTQVVPRGTSELKLVCVQVVALCQAPQ
jgi:hypothetical protein